MSVSRPKPEAGIQVEGLGKCFRMYRRPMHRIVEAVTLGKAKRHDEFWALRGVEFDLLRGQSLGLVGANGAGKSTLMKVLARITDPTEGRIKMNGRVASLLELGAGFHLDFTGRANIVMNGVMMGYSRRQMESRMDEIIEFAELGAYIDEPVRTYSSGMGLRLGFAIAIAIDPDILIIDEVFAVGDMYFQKKCVDKIYEFKKQNKTIMFCSHSLYDVRQLCDQGLWLRKGEPAAYGDSVFVTNEYTAFQRDHIGDRTEVVGDNVPTVQTALEDNEATKPRPLPKIHDARIYRMGTDEECYQCTTGDSLELRVWWENPDPVEMPVNLAVAFMRQDMTTAGGMGTHLDGLKLEGHGGCTVLEIPDIQLLSGQMLVPVLLMDEAGVHKYQEFLMPENLVIRTATKQIGLFLIEHRWRFDADHGIPKTAAQAEAAELEAAQESTAESADPTS